VLGEATVRGRMFLLHARRVPLNTFKQKMKTHFSGNDGHPARCDVSVILAPTFRRQDLHILTDFSGVLLSLVRPILNL